MAEYYKGHSLEELLYEGQHEYQPPPGDDQSVWRAARELWPTTADATTNAANSSGNNNNNNDDDDDDDDDLMVARAGPATAVPVEELLDPRLLPAAADPPATTTTAAAAPPPPAAAPAAAPAAPVASGRAGDHRRWKDDEAAYLRGCRLAGQSFQDIGRVLNRTAASCETKAKTLGLYKWGRKPGS